MGAELGLDPRLRIKPALSGIGGRFVRSVTE
jgi:hypothetical protein